MAHARVDLRHVGPALVALGVASIAGDLVLALGGVAGCVSTSTAECLGLTGGHTLGYLGLAGILAGWRLGVAAAGGTRPLERWALLVALVAIPLAASIGWFLGDEAVQGASAWDGRSIPIRLALLVAAPATVALALCAIRRGRWVPTLALTVACAAFSYAAPFVLIGVLFLVSGGGSG